jgi:Flp pilus assembly protein TadG
MKINKLKRATARSRRSQGQSMVEFALCMPFLFLILIAILYFGRYFLIAQVLLYAAQEGAKVASRTPNLSDSATRDMVRGFTTGGTALNPNSVIYSACASASLLSNKTSGNLPNGANVQILPWDSTGNGSFTAPPGTVAVLISYPFQLLGSPFTGPLGTGSVKSLTVAMSFTGQPLRFPNFAITQQAVAAQEVYQQ